MKINRITLTAFSIALLYSVKVTAQKTDIRFDYLRTEQGASQNTISAILKDRYGYLWFGTDDGLNKYDGYKVTRYRSNAKDPRSLGNNIVSSIFEDSKGRLWVGMHQGGLHLFDRNTNSFTRFLHNDTIPSSLKNNTVRAMCEDAQGNLWVGTSSGLDMMTAPGKFRHYNIRSGSDGINEEINCLLMDKQKRLWAGTNNGLAMFNSSTKSFKLYVPDDKDKSSLSQGVINAMAEDDEGNLWVGTENGLNVKKKNEDKFTHFFTNEKNSNSLAHNFIWALANDGNGRMWIGTEAGLNIYELARGQIFLYKNIPGDESSLPHNSVRCFYMDKGAVWLGCYAGGIRKYDRQLFRSGLFKPLISDPVTRNIKMVFSFAEMRNGDMLFGSDGGGLNIFRKKDKSIFQSMK